MILLNKKTGNEFKPNKETADETMKIWPGVFTKKGGDLTTEAKNVKDEAKNQALINKINNLKEIPNPTEEQTKEIKKLEDKLAK